MIRRALSRLSLARKYENLNADEARLNTASLSAAVFPIPTDSERCGCLQAPTMQLWRHNDIERHLYIPSWYWQTKIKYFIEIKVFSFQNFPNNRKWLPRNLHLWFFRGRSPILLASRRLHYFLYPSCKLHSLYTILGAWCWFLCS